MMTASDVDGLGKNASLKIDSYAGALALIDILFDAKVINKATYDNIKHNAKRNNN